MEVSPQSNILVLERGGRGTEGEERDTVQNKLTIWKVIGMLSRFKFEKQSSGAAG